MSGRLRFRNNHYVRVLGQHKHRLRLYRTPGGYYDALSVYVLPSLADQGKGPFYAVTMTEGGSRCASFEWWVLPAGTWGRKPGGAKAVAWEDASQDVQDAAARLATELDIDYTRGVTEGWVASAVIDDDETEDAL